MTKLSFSQLRGQLAEVLNEAQYNGERIVVMRHNKQVAAIISIEDLEYLEAIEDEIDAKDAQRIKKSIKNAKEKLVDWDLAKKGL